MCWPLRIVVFSLEAPSSAHQYLMIATYSSDSKQATFFGDSEGFGDLVKVEDVGFDTVESAFLLEDHLRHLVPEGVSGG